MSVNLKSNGSSCSSDCECLSGNCISNTCIKVSGSGLWNSICPKPKSNCNISFPYQFKNKTQGCIYQSNMLVAYQNAYINQPYFTSTSFNYDPVYAQVLSEGESCANSDLFCGPGLVCGANSVCIPFSKNSLVCPHYSPQANMGGATWKFINGQCQYPTPTIQSGMSANYTFNWGYGQGYSCGADDECVSGMQCLGGYCTPPPNQMEWYVRQNNGATCTNNNQCISGACGEGNVCVKVGENGICPANIESDPAYSYMYRSDLGCIVKSITGYSNSSDFSTSQFNMYPQYNYVLPQNYVGCEGDALSCPNGQICQYDKCVDYSPGDEYNSSCPSYNPHPINYGIASWKVCESNYKENFDFCDYPTASTRNGNPGNYSFNWLYGNGCYCGNQNNMCQSGYCGGDGCCWSSEKAYHDS